MPGSHDQLINQWYFSHAPPNERVWQKAFLKWVQEQSRGPDTPNIHKNAKGLVGIPLKWGATGTRR